ncbi:bifunctional phosphoribosylaminoimidazolecarboxamide formyltransferase/IMP cyclohydrolase [Planktomarina sp.]|nr:bifunctional phosphoribosylaminoimidazolecarboxamide formyltransferase/IMP cyclohydrolase [Planktomarina sp.]
MIDLIKLRRALISVSDKTGLLELAHALVDRGVELVSTGGTAIALRDAGLDVLDVETITGFPEMMDGRVKTLHPSVHGGLLALRDNANHNKAMEEYGITGIDLLVVNLYPFEETVTNGADYMASIENIDIGGPAMIRAAAKNHKFVTVVTDTQDYSNLLKELSELKGSTSYFFRQKLALNAFARTASYDAAISNWMAKEMEVNPRYKVISGSIVQELRYGENPHQAAVFYGQSGSQSGVGTAVQHQGKKLSYNNINDTDAAIELVGEFGPAEGPACAIIKHANPCGVSQAATLKKAYQAAFNCDQKSAFGGIVALNQKLDGITATEICKIFTEVVIAPDADNEARKIFSKKKNLRLLTIKNLPDVNITSQTIRQVLGGYLVQDKDMGRVSPDDLKVVTKRSPTSTELSDMLFAWKVAKHVKSNAIVYVKNGATVGIGAGQMSRVDSALIAARKAREMAAELNLKNPLTHGSVVASDAFFPFADGILTVAEAGAMAIIQPGGSVRDEEVIAAANAAGLTMIFTGMRHFRH